MHLSRLTKALVHKHLIIDAELERKLVFSKRQKITSNLIEKLIDILDMKPLAKLEVYDALDDSFPGWSFIQPITTSHISGHYFEGNPSTIHFDIYSCKDFEPKTVLKILDSDLCLRAWSAVFVNRNINSNMQTVMQFSS